MAVEKIKEMQRKMEEEARRVEQESRKREEVALRDKQNKESLERIAASEALERARQTLIESGVYQEMGRIGEELLQGQVKKWAVVFNRNETILTLAWGEFLLKKDKDRGTYIDYDHGFLGLGVGKVDYFYFGISANGEGDLRFDDRCSYTSEGLDGKETIPKNDWVDNKQVLINRIALAFLHPNREYDDGTPDYYEPVTHGP